MMKLRSIRWRIVASMMAVALLTVLAVGVLAQLFVGREIARREADVLRGNAESVAVQAGELFSPELQGDALTELAEAAAFLTQARVVIADGESSVLADSGPIAGADELVWFGSGAHAATGMIVVEDDAGPSGDRSVELHLGSLIGVPDLPVPPIERSGDVLSDGRITVIRRSGDEWGSLLEFETALDAAHLAEVIAEAERVGAPASAEPLDHLDGLKRLDHFEGIEAIFRLNREPASSMRVTVPVGDMTGPAGFVTLYSPPDFGASTLAATQRALLMAAALALGLAAVVGVVVSRGVTAPIEALTGAADRMAGGDLGARAPVVGTEELGRLGRAFNRMAQQLQGSFGTLADERDSLRRFVSDASHELRTPITALTNFNELLRGPAGDDPVARDEFLGESAEQLDRLGWITTNLLDLSRLEMGLMALDVAPHPVMDLLTAAAGIHRTSAREADIDIRPPRLDESLMLHCDRRHVELALGNLVENAIKFTPAGGVVTIGAEQVGGDFHLWVQDTGPGIAGAEATHVFERFYRGAAASECGADGNGLGLAIVQAVAIAHEGSARVESPHEGGSKFVIVLPLAGPTDPTRP